MKRTILALPLLLAGCGTPGDVMQQAPALAFETSNTPDQVRACLSDSRPGELNVTPYKAGWMIADAIHTVYGRSDDSTMWVVTAMPSPKGAHVEVFRNGFTLAFEKTAKPCLDSLPKV